MMLLLRRPLCSQLTECRYMRQRATACARAIRLVTEGGLALVEWIRLSRDVGGILGGTLVAYCLSLENSKFFDSIFDRENPFRMCIVTGYILFPLDPDGFTSIEKSIGYAKEYHNLPLGSS